MSAKDVVYFQPKFDPMAELFSGSEAQKVFSGSATPKEPGQDKMDFLADLDWSTLDDLGLSNFFDVLQYAVCGYLVKTSSSFETAHLAAEDIVVNLASERATYGGEFPVSRGAVIHVLELCGLGFVDANRLSEAILNVLLYLCEVAGDERASERSK